MDNNFGSALAYTLKFEGGWTNDPDDAGGPTMKGVTHATYKAFCRQCGLPEPSVEDLHNISDEHLQSLYYNNYWLKCGANRLPSGLDFAAWDVAVNSGPSKAIKWLQKLVHQTPTGKMNDGLFAAIDQMVQSHGGDPVISAYCAERKAFFYALVAAKPSQSKFLRGWLRRVVDLEAIALKMNDNDPAPETIGKAAEDDHHDDTAEAA